ncbi:MULTISPECIES: N-acyl homoserine lactonase family protein [unclassified Duganella]|uniref:N-acyl homoserine lactonase family protein n=1 Tax=unclassified Duganella TaxID=2636909 RepID=UPI0008890AC9|nr:MULTISPECIES: N-acyl homoserine lactonase family protein [unclassified Duganella]SDF37975.1 Metallo-beta-lactamase superfamily protein [Duganella sp. OV458]SDI88351.1 Metallo-beta-lactamase superfamily protein [Duganella sp. OV510]
MKRFLSGLAFAAFSFAAAATAYAATPDVRMYRLDCGYMTLGDKSVMSDEGLYQGQSYDIVMSCYLIKHGDDWLLWDAGLPEKYLAGPITEGSFATGLDRTIVEQLADLGLRADDIKYVAVSHSHFDHSGQVNSFPNATLIIQRGELEAMADTKKAAAHYIDAGLFSSHISGDKLQRVRIIDGDVDLFGDGTLQAIQTPGHTPGSMALLLKLNHAGYYVLSGDQWHFTENHQRQQVPTWNYNHQQTVASGNKLDQLIAGKHATLVIQHEPVDNQKLSKMPGFLD